MAKYMTKSEAATAKDKAARLMESTGQSDRADEFRSMSVAEYAEHRGATLMDNPRTRRGFMARKDELEDQIETIEDLVEEALDPELSREELVAKVKEIKDTIEGEEEDEDSDLDEDEDEENPLE